MDMARSMMRGKQLSNEYWGEGVSCVVYILNRCPTKNIKDKTPEETCSGNFFSVSYLRILGVWNYHMCQLKLKRN